MDGSIGGLFLLVKGYYVRVLPRLSDATGPDTVCMVSIVCLLLSVTLCFEFFFL
jgi:hypothetical protein